MTVILMSVGCQAPAAVSVAPPMVPTATERALQPVAAVTIKHTLTPSLPPVVIQIIEDTATPPPALLLPSAEELVTATPIPTDTPPPSPTSSPVPSATPTPPPTFTPPALPGTSPNEHYYLRRPIPEGNAVWTDKTYPYGSTRGGTLRPHHGVEFNVGAGTAVLAAGTGTVVVAGNDNGTAWGEHTTFYGNLVVIEHEFTWRGQPVYTLYGHLSQIGVAVGQRIESQQPIALSGSSGIADGPHLHFEVRIGRNTYDATRNPLLWLYPFKDHGTVAGLLTRGDGSQIEGVLVTATRIDAASPYKGTTTYTGTSVNSDSGWRENFVLDDLKAGYYRITATIGEQRYKTETWVYPYQTSFVEIEIGAGSQ